jgi:hypothetical protein
MSYDILQWRAVPHLKVWYAKRRVTVYLSGSQHHSTDPTYQIARYMKLIAKVYVDGSRRQAMDLTYLTARHRKWRVRIRDRSFPVALVTIYLKIILGST